MNKVSLGAQSLFYPMPVFLIGARVNDKPAFMVAAWGTICNHEPPMFAVAVRRSRYTLNGIKQHAVFSVNVPSVDQVKEVDFCGITSGNKGVDKVQVCQFKVFYGKLEKAPLIEQCPVNMACQVIHVLDELSTHTIFVGQIVETYISESCLTDGRPDMAKVNPLLYIPSPGTQYQALGNIIAKAYRVGKELQTI